MFSESKQESLINFDRSQLKPKLIYLCKAERLVWTVERVNESGDGPLPNEDTALVR